MLSLEDGVFEPEITAAMGDAFEAACGELHCARDDRIRERIAARIIAAARKGELDRERLRTIALTVLSAAQPSAAHIQPASKML
jgi:DNA invertase Pin-like site-specific DNA recombinase